MGEVNVQINIGQCTGAHLKRFTAMTTVLSGIRPARTETVQPARRPR